MFCHHYSEHHCFVLNTVTYETLFCIIVPHCSLGHCCLTLFCATLFLYNNILLQTLFCTSLLCTKHCSVCQCSVKHCLCITVRCKTLFCIHVNASCKVLLANGNLMTGIWLRVPLNQQKTVLNLSPHHSLVHFHDSFGQHYTAAMCEVHHTTKRTSKGQWREKEMDKIHMLTSKLRTPFSFKMRLKVTPGKGKTFSWISWCKYRQDCHKKGDEKRE